LQQKNRKGIDRGKGRELKTALTRRVTSESPDGTRKRNSRHTIGSQPLRRFGENQRATSWSIGEGSAPKEHECPVPKGSRGPRKTSDCTKGGSHSNKDAPNLENKRVEHGMRGLENAKGRGREHTKKKGIMFSLKRWGGEGTEFPPQREGSPGEKPGGYFVW